MALDDHPQFISSDELAQDIKLIMIQPMQIGILKCATLEEWMAFAAEYLNHGDDVLSDEAIQSFIQFELGNGKKFSECFPENHRICITMVPCDFDGTRLSSFDIKNGSYIQKLKIDPSGVKNIATAKDKNIYNLQPDEIRNNCSFEVGKYLPHANAQADVDIEDKKRVLTEFYSAIKNLQLFWRQYKQKNGHKVS